MPLTPEELQIVDELEFEHVIAECVRAQSASPLERLKRRAVMGASESAAGLSIAVADGNEAERVMTAIRPTLESMGYCAFWSFRHAGNGSRDTDEVAILKTTDPYAMIRLRQTDGANYSVSTDDILERLSAWKKLCAFNVVGADHDWVAIQFIRLPERICTFAEEVYLFCPDSVVQGVGLRREKDHPQDFKDARLLCPTIKVESESAEATLQKIGMFPPEQAEEFKRLYMMAAKHSTPTEMGIRLLALEISRSNYLFLWWD